MFEYGMGKYDGVSSFKTVLTRPVDCSLLTVRTHHRGGALTLALLTH